MADLGLPGARGADQAKTEFGAGLLGGLNESGAQTALQTT
jgi:hypothetical protein